MKKLTISMIALVLSAIFLALSGCEMSFDLEPTTVPAVTTTEPNTAVIEVTDENGVVLETQTVTASPEAEQFVKDFFAPVTQPATQAGDRGEPKPNTGVSNDRLQQAIQQQQATTKPDSQGTTKPAGNAKPNGGATNKPENNFADAVQQDDSAVLKSSQYLVSMRSVDADGQVVTYKVARKNNRTAIFFAQNGEQMGVILNNDMIYYMSIDQKVYIEIPKSWLEDQAKKENVDFDFSMMYRDPMDVERVVKSTGAETIDGVEYTYKEYENGIKDYFIGKTLIMSKGTDGSVLYYDSLSPVAPESVFLPPAGFKKEDLNAENVSEFVEEMPSEHDHEHE